MPRKFNHPKASHMTQQLKTEIDLRATELHKLEEQLKVLQIAQTAPLVDTFDNATDFMQAMRQFHTSERDRLDELSATEAVLPNARAKLQELRDRFDGIKHPVDAHFEELAAAALEANQIFEQAEAAFEKVFAMCQHQAEIGHSTIHNCNCLDIVQSPKLPIFCVSSNKISVLGRQQFKDYRNSDNISEGVRV